MGTHQRLTQVYFEAMVITTRGALRPCAQRLMRFYPGEKFTAMSAPSEPFIVCTNIKQWVKSEGTILKVRDTSLRN